MNLKNKFKKLFKISLFLSIILILFIFSVNIYIIFYSGDNIINDISELEAIEVWLVPWALVYKDWSPSPILWDRLEVAYKAYKEWKIEKIIVSGDNSREDYNEPVNMQNYLVSLWVKKDDIYIDYAWFDTYDSLYRAREIFSVEKLVVFTQDFHLNRSLYIWEKLWIETYWVTTDLQEYYGMKRNNLRELLARVKAFLDVEIFSSKPKFLGEKVSMSIVQDKVE